MTGPPAAAPVWRRYVAMCLPAVMPVMMKVVFDATARRYGPQRGYQAGFAVYWATCWVAAAALVGGRRLRGLWRVPQPVLPAPPGLSMAVLLTPPLGGLVTQWFPHARASGPVAIAMAAAVGTTNALAEEAFWRGVPVTIFPDDRLRGWLWPAVGFTVWHLVPLSLRPSSTRRRTSLLTGAAVIGLGYGWIALRTRSLAITGPAHAITDSSGLLPVRANWLPH